MKLRFFIDRPEFSGVISVVKLKLNIITMFSNKLTDKYSEDLGYGGKQK